MTKTWGRTVVLVVGLFVLASCGGAVEPGADTGAETGAPDTQAVAGEYSSRDAGDVEALAGRGHGCPRQGGECRAYCQAKGHASGGCSGYGGGSCECRDPKPPR